MVEMERLSLDRPSQRRVEQQRSLFAWGEQQILDEQVELWWFGEPRLTLLCYGASVGLVLALSLAGIGLLSTASSAMGHSGVWRLGMGSTLCLLALVVLLKQLLSSAVQDMGCVQRRSLVEWLRSGGGLDPPLLLAAGLGVVVCGATLLGLSEPELLLPGVLLVACGGAVMLVVVVYSLVALWQRQRAVRRRRRRGRRQGRQRRMMRAYTVSGAHSQPWRDSASSQISLI